MHAATAPTTARPPITPPTIAPVGVGDPWLEAAALGIAIEAVVVITLGMYIDAVVVTTLGMFMEEELLLIGMDMPDDIIAADNTAGSEAVTEPLSIFQLEAALVSPENVVSTSINLDPESLPQPYCSIAGFVYVQAHSRGLRLRC